MAELSPGDDRLRPIVDRDVLMHAHRLLPTGAHLL
jgi:hypothetical protein